MAISSYFFFKQVLENKDLDKEYEKIQDIVTTEIVDKTSKDNKKDIIEIIDLKELYQVNSDLIGWIKIDGTNVNYPVMQNEDYYLRLLYIVIMDLSIIHLIMQKIVQILMIMFLCVSNYNFMKQVKQQIMEIN